ncbi:MAG: flagellar biosynthesis protein FlgL [Pseudomonadota bacterium]
MSIVSNSTAAFYQRSLGQMSGLRSELERLQAQVATGERFDRSSDDPVAASRLRALARAERLDTVNGDNADRLSRDLEAASDQITGVSNLLIRAREIAINAGNDAIGDEARNAIATELEELGEELFNRANSNALSGEPLFAGEIGTSAYVRNPDGSASYAGTAVSGSLTVADGVSIERGVTGPQVFEFAVGGTPGDAFALIADLAVALRTGTDPGAAARDTLAGFDAALESSNRSQTVVGARLAWIDSLQQNQIDREFLRAEEQAEVGGADLTESIAQLQQTLTVLEASQASFARLSSLSLFNAL